jgi:hypothetical protein
MVLIQSIFSPENKVCIYTNTINELWLELAIVVFIAYGVFKTTFTPDGDTK